MKPTIEPLRIGLTAIKNQFKKENRWSKTFDEMFDGYPVFQATNKLQEAILKILQKIYKDEEDDIIGWWVYEKEFGKKKNLNVYEKGSNKIIPTKTIEDLYNYLIKYHFKDEEDEVKWDFQFTDKPHITYTDDITRHNPPFTIYCKGTIMTQDGNQEEYQFPWQVLSEDIKFNK